jgi:hypothetical protein
MKKKILNHIKIIILILIGVTIIFAILGSFKRTKENMEDAPQCYSDFHSDVQCYSDVLPSNDVDTEHATYNESKDDKYILKTKIIPPKGTSCPIEISAPATNFLNGVKGDSTGTNTDSTGTNTDSSATKATDSLTQIQNSSNSNSSNTSNSVTNITNVAGTPESSKSTPVAAESASSTPSSVPGPIQNDAIIQNTAALNEIKGSITQINQQKPKPETCPPCPACERCPEPAFDCKKVPNYRSPSIGQYLPMPILNDFSTF